MKKLFDLITKKISENPILNSYFMNYFFIKEPVQPPLPFILYCINNLDSFEEKNFCQSQNQFFEIDLSLKIFSNDFEFDELSKIINLIIKILDSFIFIDDYSQISLKNYKTQINHEYEKKRNKDFDFFKIEIFFKAWHFEKILM